ncbi:MAG: hypothetical protein ACK6A9_20370 [Dolichospermum sp.]
MKNCRNDNLKVKMENGTGNRKEVLTFSYLCRFFSVHLFNIKYK